MKQKTTPLRAFLKGIMLHFGRHQTGTFGTSQKTHKNHSKSRNPKMVQKNRAVIYARVSTDDQSCDRQIQDLKIYADRADYQVVGIYKEVGSGAKNDRKERKKIIALAQKRAIDIVLVTELTRWGRSLTDLMQTLMDLHDRGVRLVAMNGQNFDLGTASGKAMLGLMSVMAEFERDLITERIKSGMDHARRKGKQIGREAGDDYKVRKMEGRVMKMREEGYTIRSIAKHLRISPTTVQKILNQSKLEALL